MRSPISSLASRSPISVAVRPGSSLSSVAATSDQYSLALSGSVFDGLMRLVSRSEISAVIILILPQMRVRLAPRVQLLRSSWCPITVVVHRESMMSSRSSPEDLGGVSVIANVL